MERFFFGEAESQRTKTRSAKKNHRHFSHSVRKNPLSPALLPNTHSPLKTWDVNYRLNAKKVVLSTVYCVNLYASSKTGLQGVFLKILRMAVYFYIQLFWGLTICPSTLWGVNSLLKSQSSFCAHVLHKPQCFLFKNSSFFGIVLWSPFRNYVCYSPDYSAVWWKSVHLPWVKGSLASLPQSSFCRYYRTVTVSLYSVDKFRKVDNKGEVWSSNRLIHKL